MNEEIQQENTRAEGYKVKAIPVIDHRLLASKLTVHDWMQDIPASVSAPAVAEVRFKNTRKGFYANPYAIPLQEGDIVAVEAAMGHDIGVISLTGELVREQLHQKRLDSVRAPFKKIYRKARRHDIDKWRQAISLEYDTMTKSREIANELGLDMKIGDVEYQGDKTKAIFYYIAGDRVDFRKLIRVLADTFHVRVEMKQIGARQEAGRLGGIGSCGRNLCCCSFITNFSSVSTSAARYQDISLNPNKLAGQCGKLKCCLNFELDAYIDGQKDFPAANIPLNTGEGMLYFQKSDTFGRMITYSFDKEGRGLILRISVERAREIIAMNKRGQIPPKASTGEQETRDIKYTDGVGEESLNRFDDQKTKKHGNRNRNRRKLLQKKGEIRENPTNQPSVPKPAPPQAGNPTNQGKTTPRDDRHRPDRHRNHPRPHRPQPPVTPESES
jgi:cell fate regulator YaaT (PSP1 superfamily)